MYSDQILLYSPIIILFDSNNQEVETFIENIVVIASSKAIELLLVFVWILI